MASADDQRPAELNTRRSGPGLEVNKDELVVTYTIVPRHNSDVGAIQSIHPIPLDCRVYYFEITVLNPGEGGRIGIGFSDQNFNTSKQPGWDSYSYGYHGDDGKKFHSSQGQPFAETFGKDAIVGAGYHLQRQEIFFTKDGKKLGTAFYRVRGAMYPTIGLHSKNACVQVNIGATKFKFDIEGMLAEERKQELEQVQNVQMSAGDAHQLVREYLLHYGYAGTLQAFQAASGNMTNANRAKSWEASTLALRQEVRTRVLAGETGAALLLIQQHHPSLLEGAGGEHEPAFHLYCQQYIDLVREGKIEEAVTHAQKVLWQLRSPSHPHRDNILRDVIALVAYPKPETCPLAHLLAVAQREAVADVANTAILSLDPNRKPGAPIKPGLERLLQQLVAVHEAIREANNNQGEVFRLQKHLCST